MAVTSREIPPADSSSKPASRQMTMWPLGIVAILVGLALWPLGARYSLEGWVNVLNLLLGLLNLPVAIPMPTGWWWLLFLPIGLLYSLVEILVPFGLPRSWAHLPMWALAIFLLALVHGSDLGTTFAGYLFPAADAWAIHTWAAGPGRWALVIWTIVLTYLPERALLQGLRWIGVRRKAHGNTRTNDSK